MTTATRSSRETSSGVFSVVADPGPVRVAFALIVLTVAMTWPLALGVSRDVPGDLGDSLLNMWILGWGAETVPRLLTGATTLADYWNANIFHPEPLALGFSEHLFGPVLQILPVYYTTGNLILAYNLLFLSSFVLSGLGMYLLTRDILARQPWGWLAACVAALIYAFVPLRIAQVAHLQSLSSQWMPLALYGFRRFVWSSSDGSSGGDLNAGVTRPRLRPLAGGTAALTMQNWSCGYYLIFFAPVVVLFVLHQMAASGRWRDWRRWAWLAGAAAVVTAATWPFLSLYLDARRVHGFERSLSEVVGYSADVYGYLTAPTALRLWGGTLQAYPKAEGELFLGVVPMALSLVALAGATRLAARRAHPADPTPSRAADIAVRILIGLLLVQGAVLVASVALGGFVTSLAGLPIRATNPLRIVGGMLFCLALMLAVSSRTRHEAAIAVRSPLTLSFALLLLALLMSLGPRPASHGRALQGIGLYGVFFDAVPGFDGLRVPARYAMVAALFLSVVSAYGARHLFTRIRWPRVAAGLTAGALLAETAFAPMALNQTWSGAAGTPPPRVQPAARAPAVYRYLATLDDARVVTEFPFGDPEWELRYVYYSTVHWKRLVNGYSGGFPAGYTTRVARLQRIAQDPEPAWQSLAETGTTHVVIHEDAYPADGAVSVTTWLRAHGAVERGRFDRDVLFELPRHRTP